MSEVVPVLRGFEGRLVAAEPAASTAGHRRSGMSLVKELCPCQPEYWLLHLGRLGAL